MRIVLKVLECVFAIGGLAFLFVAMAVAGMQ